ncbi:MAG: Gfo/Idh/MocA family oxidoreductase [Veillonellales bacterium]
MRKIRFGIIGCGSIAATHVQAIRAIPQAELIGAASRSEEKAKQFAEKWGFDYSPDVQALLSRKDIDAVTICTPSGLHGDIAIAAARAGKHVVMEKPLEITLEKADEVIRTCRECGVELGVIFQRRYAPGIMQAKQLLTDGIIGKLCFGGCYVKWYRSQEYYDSGAWRGTWKMDGGGVLMNQAIHYVDMLQYLAGPVKNLSARCGTYAHSGIEVEDQAVAHFQFTNGALGVLEATVNAYPGLAARIDIYGTQGSLVIENDELRFVKCRDGRAITGPQQVAEEPVGGPVVPFDLHRQQLTEIVAAFLQSRAPQVDGREGRKSLELVLAMYDSAFHKRPVELPLQDSLFMDKLAKSAAEEQKFP